MDVATMTTRLKTRFRDTAGSVVSDPAWLGYLNDAYADVNGTLPWWPWMESHSTDLSIAASGTSVALPANASRVTNVWNKTEQVQMVPLEGRSTYRNLYPFADEVGTPTHYRIFGATLEVFPLPTATTLFRVDYFAPPAELVTAEPVFPSQYHRILIEGAMARAYEDDGNPEQAGIHHEHYNAILAGMVLDLGSGDRQDRYPGITDTWND